MASLKIPQRLNLKKRSHFSLHVFVLVILKSIFLNPDGNFHLHNQGPSNATKLSHIVQLEPLGLPSVLFLWS